MQAKTFTQKLLRQRGFLSYLFPLFALFIGVGAVTPAFAQPTGASTATIRNVVVTAGTSSASATTDIYDAIATSGGSGIGGGIFAGTNFGSIDVNTGRLLLQGGTVEIVETAGEVYDRAFINFGVAPGTTAPTPAPGLTQTIELVQTNYNAGTSTRTFSLTNAARNLLALVTTAGSPGTSYRFDVTVNAAGVDASGDDVQTSGSSSRRRSIFNATGTPSTASVSANTISFDPNGVPPSPPVTTPPTPPTPNDIVTYNINPATPNPFQGANLGSYDVNTGQLLLNNTVVTTTEAGSNVVTGVVLYYRTRSTSAGGGAFQPITLTQSGSGTGGTRTFVLDSARTSSTFIQPNLIATPAVTAAGTYVLEIYYQASGFNSTTGVNFTLTDPPTANTYYSSTFTVTGTPPQTTIWTGAKNDNWFDAANWSAGVPTSTINALVRDLGAGNGVPYPNINSDVQVFSTGGVLLYSNLNSGPAQCLNLIMSGSSQAARSITRLVAGHLQVFGNFDNTYDSFIQRENTILQLAGVNQTITGGTFFRVDISGGGNKTLLGGMNISSSLNFLTGVSTGDSPAAINPVTAPSANAGILSTNINQPTVSLVVLADRSANNANNGAQITGETDESFLYGFVRTNRQGVLVTETRTYGNMGMTLTFTGTNNPGNVEVTRNTVEAYNPLSNRFGVRRIFGVRPADAATTTGGLTATMIFRYRDSETRNLNGPSLATPGTSSIPEPNLTIFVSSNSGNTFQSVGRDGPVNVVNNTVTRTGVRNFATFTLGDIENPLPVRLTAFDAKRVGSDVLVTWQTANELNSKGYEVQVSTNGTEFRTLSFVESASPNSTRLLSYSYADKEANKTGTRYYRLRQIDLDGKQEFFAPKSVSFDGKATASNIVAYPNPFNSNDELHVAVQSPKAGKGQLRVTDMTGRTIRQESVELASGIADVTVGGMKELKAGLYMVRLTLPSGETQNLKVVKQ